MTNPPDPQQKPPGSATTPVADLLEALSQSFRDEADGVRGDLKKYEEANKRERRAWLLILSFLIAAIVVALGLIATVRIGLNVVKHTSEQVESCTTPDGECAKRQAATVSDFRTKLIASFAIVTDCDVSTDDLQIFRKCVEERTGLDSSTTIAKLLAEADREAAAAAAKASASPSPR